MKKFEQKFEMIEMFKFKKKHLSLFGLRCFRSLWIYPYRDSPMNDLFWMQIHQVVQQSAEYLPDHWPSDTELQNVLDPHRSC